MYKFVFELITDPLGLPISFIWEYVILLVLHEIAFQIAWKASPGGRWGSEIHWAVRIPTFIVLWAVVYGVIWIAKWLFNNWILVLSILGGVIFISGIILLYRKKRKAKRKSLCEK